MTSYGIAMGRAGIAQGRRMADDGVGVASVARVSAIRPS